MLRTEAVRMSGTYHAVLWGSAALSSASHKISKQSLYSTGKWHEQLCVVSVKNLEHEVPHLSDFISDMIYKFRFQTLNSSRLPLLRPALNIANVCFFKFYRSQKKTTEQPPQDSRERVWPKPTKAKKTAGLASKAWLDTLSPAHTLAPTLRAWSILTAEC